MTQATHVCNIVTIDSTSMTRPESNILLVTAKYQYGNLTWFIVFSKYFAKMEVELIVVCHVKTIQSVLITENLQKH